MASRQDGPSVSAEEIACRRLDEAAQQLQRDSRFHEALECLERGLVLRQRLYGVKSDEVWAACKAAGELCNLLAMTSLQKGASGPRPPPPSPHAHPPPPPPPHTQRTTPSS
jgi:hypothetical protein